MTWQEFRESLPYITLLRQTKQCRSYHHFIQDCLQRTFPLRICAAVVSRRIVYCTHRPSPNWNERNTDYHHVTNAPDNSSSESVELQGLRSRSGREFDNRTTRSNRGTYNDMSSSLPHTDSLPVRTCHVTRPPLLGLRSKHNCRAWQRQQRRAVRIRYST